MTHWEYQVIHLNVAGGATPPPAGGQAQAGAPAAGAAAAKPPQVFSQEYLQKEFPGFYTPNPASQQHPALQLQTFLNGVGQKGWSLIGVFPLGPLLMMIFRRRLSAPSASPEPAAASPEPEGQPQATPSPAPDLESLLKRIESLEQRLDPPEPS
jgi:hypothetical protein